jgi:serine/threonine protein kinase
MYADGTRISSNQIIGRGLDGVVVLIGDTVLKAPNRHGIYQNGVARFVEDACEISDALENENRVYARLEKTKGVAKFLGTSRNGLNLEYYSNGSLEQYMDNHAEPELAWKENWITEIVDVVTRCHEKRVLISDIALRNFLLAEDWSIRVIDFANSVLFEIDLDLAEAEEEGCTATLDLFHLGNVIYSIATWRKFSVDCAMESEWPGREEMPRLEHFLPYGAIVANCWTRQYASACELRCEIEGTGKMETCWSLGSD